MHFNKFNFIYILSPVQLSNQCIQPLVTSFINIAPISSTNPVPLGLPREYFITTVPAILTVSGVLREGMLKGELPNNHHLGPRSPCPQPDPASFPQKSGLWCSSGWSPSGWRPHSPHRRYGPWHVAWQTQSKSGPGGHLCCYCCREWRKMFRDTS